MRIICMRNECFTRTICWLGLDERMPIPFYPFALVDVCGRQIPRRSELFLAVRDWFMLAFCCAVIVGAVPHSEWQIGSRIEMHSPKDFSPQIWHCENRITFLRTHELWSFMNEIWNALADHKYWSVPTQRACSTLILVHLGWACLFEPLDASKYLQSTDVSNHIRDYYYYYYH